MKTTTTLPKKRIGIQKHVIATTGDIIWMAVIERKNHVRGHIVSSWGSAFESKDRKEVVKFAKDRIKRGVNIEFKPNQNGN